MRLAQLQRPLRSVAVGPCIPPLRPVTTLLCCRLGPNANNSFVDGRRFASVKAQGAYKVSNSKRPMKKMGAKRVGDQYVIPGNIIYKQRGTVWHPGENTILGRDHTIHAAVAGYVKYYRDPELHPRRQYIGVAFERSDKLPYPHNGVRRRKLGMVAVPRREVTPLSKLSSSGIPRKVMRGVDDVSFVTEGGEEVPPREKKSVKSRKPPTVRSLAIEARRQREGTRVFHLQSDYSYREYNWELGRLVGMPGQALGKLKKSRRARLRSIRRKVNKKLQAFREVKMRKRMSIARAEHNMLMRWRRREEWKAANLRAQERKAKDLRIQERKVARAARAARRAAKAEKATKGPRINDANTGKGEP